MVAKVTKYDITKIGYLACPSLHRKKGGNVHAAHRC